MILLQISSSLVRKKMKRKLGNRLKEARFYANKAQIQLWLETGVHYSTISRIECGYIKPTEMQKRRLASALGVKKDLLFLEDSNK